MCFHGGPDTSDSKPVQPQFRQVTADELPFPGSTVFVNKYGDVRGVVQSNGVGRQLTIKLDIPIRIGGVMADGIIANASELFVAN